jgi:hypothetical protein
MKGILCLMQGRCRECGEKECDGIDKDGTCKYLDPETRGAFAQDPRFTHERVDAHREKMGKAPWTWI